MVSLYQICWLLLAQITPGEGNAPVEGDGAAPEGGLFDNLMFFLPAMIMVMLVYMLLMGRPQQGNKGRAANAERLAGLKKNDRVVTAGGIIGTVVNVRDDMEHITLRVDDSTGTRMQILKQSIARVMNEEDDSDEDK
ncbi:MAG: preprotein translocase subunit YajC [Planctomycetota bacterium]